MKKRAKHANAAGHGDNLVLNSTQRACTSVCMAKRFSVILQVESRLLSNWEEERERERGVRLPSVHRAEAEQ